MVKQAEVRVLSATGCCGSGFKESSFEAGLAMDPHFIGSDCGSTDPGPFSLGTGKTAFSRDAMKRDLGIMMKAARRTGIPLLMGSAGTAGGEPHLALLRDIALEIAAEAGLSCKLALIHAEQDKQYLKNKLANGRIKPLKPAPKFDDEVIDRAVRIVGMMGAEPFMRALDEGANIVIAGRASDCAIFAGIPIRMGIPPGLAWHAGKILECGAAAVVSRTHTDSMFATLRQDHFDMQPLHPAMRATPQSIAAHSLYENSNPYRLVESSGILDLTEASYEAIDDRNVRVRGSRFEPAERYTVKLEGAERAGFQSVMVFSVRDPYIIRQLDDWLSRFDAQLRANIAEIYAGRLSPEDYVFNTRVYGKNGSLGPLEPVQQITSHEVCLVMEATAPSQEIANAIASAARHKILHFPIPEWSGLISGVADPHNPATLERGAVYRFCVNHVVEPEDPYEMFPIEHISVN